MQGYKTHGSSKPSRQRQFSYNRNVLLVLVFLILYPFSLPACSQMTSNGTLSIVAAEAQYGSIASLIAGNLAVVHSIELNPNTDPHVYEASAYVANEIDTASIVIYNGLGYDSWIDSLFNNAQRTQFRINVGSLKAQGLKSYNPHVFYNLSSVLKLALVLKNELIKLKPQAAAGIRSRYLSFVQSVNNLQIKINAFALSYPQEPVLTTEPVADYLLNSLNCHILTPESFEVDIMNGVDPSPQDIALLTKYLETKSAKALIYNLQVTDTTTDNLLTLARNHNVPVVGIYEIMPTQYNYLSWQNKTFEDISKSLINS